MAPHELNIVHHRGVIFQKGRFVAYSGEFAAISAAIFIWLWEVLYKWILFY